MTRRALMSADVENSGGSIGVSQAAQSISGGILTAADATNAVRLVGVSTPCKFVRIMPRVDSNGNPLNTKPCFVGESQAQVLATAGAIPVMVSNYEGVIIPVDDASKLWVKIGANNEGVAYRIFA